MTKLELLLLKNLIYSKIKEGWEIGTIVQYMQTLPMETLDIPDILEYFFDPKEIKIIMLNTYGIELYPDCIL